MKLSLNSCSRSELTELIVSLGEKKYRAEQVYRWLYHDKVLSVEKMTNLSKALRESLSNLSEITVIKEQERAVSAVDGSMKILFSLDDGNRVESVILRDKDRITACISTQVGCKMGCKFCATAGIGFKRNLNTAEILEQIHQIEQIILNDGLSKEPRLTNIVFMGMGEPLDNFDNVTKAFEILTDEQAYSYSYRRITLSTVGLIPKIKQLFALDITVRLAVSLNAPNQGIRKDIMPISIMYPLEELIKTLKGLPLQKRERITFEYVLINGVNDSVSHAKELVRLVKGLPVKLNLIKYNGGGDPVFTSPQYKNILDFQSILIDNGLSAFIRKSLGADILGACGQLAAGYNK